jgi:hypothetical protein
MRRTSWIDQRISDGVAVLLCLPWFGGAFFWRRRIGAMADGSPAVDSFRSCLTVLGRVRCPAARDVGRSFLTALSISRAARGFFFVGA